MFPVTVCPATCELCGNWLPQHQTSCPRNGVHPSQWTCSSSSTFDILTSIEQQQQQQQREEDSLFLSLSLLKKDNYRDESLL